MFDSKMYVPILILFLLGVVTVMGIRPLRVKMNIVDRMFFVLLRSDDEWRRLLDVTESFDMDVIRQFKGM